MTSLTHIVPVHTPVTLYTSPTGEFSIRTYRNEVHETDELELVDAWNSTMAYTEPVNRYGDRIRFTDNCPAATVQVVAEYAATLTEFVRLATVTPTDVRRPTPKQVAA